MNILEDALVTAFKLGAFIVPIWIVVKINRRFELTKRGKGGWVLITLIAAALLLICFELEYQFIKAYYPQELKRDIGNW